MKETSDCVAVINSPSDASRAECFPPQSVAGYKDHLEARCEVCLCVNSRK